MCKNAIKNRLLSGKLRIAPMELHILHGQALIGNNVFFELASCNQELTYMRLQSRGVQFFRLTFDFIESGLPGQFVYGDDIDLCLAVAAPPVVDLRDRFKNL